MEGPANEEAAAEGSEPPNKPQSPPHLEVVRWPNEQRYISYPPPPSRQEAFQAAQHQSDPEQFASEHAYQVLKERPPGVIAATFLLIRALLKFASTMLLTLLFLLLVVTCVAAI